ncbi:MAG: phosphatidylinositol kinase [Alphaproteobacteria bacterium 16-39-46]|nr:MAG: phosphatidylinositol kinase [Alphaproteobacteria bacterium 16-39-46]OZA43677.1 MAG: phosphatidylinositol kinase [Alphaproteobacteria bacterium 17-39-52]HQS83725.1 type II toxin-antitoxin system HipA family toxin [Alphaproteobacteria bacterium]HQS93516.1 type II toxin-antitoxin system HipA family toxin [Alphaproteobacteria bacterium]
MNQILDVFFHEVLCGQLIQNKSGQLSFRYHKSYREKNDSSPISVLFPLQEPSYEGDKVKAYFSGLLPDDIVRHRLAEYLGLSEKNPFSLLEAIGGECAGALTFYPEGESPSSPLPEDIEILDDYKLKEILDLLKKRPLMAGSDGIRLSLAGAQDKIAVGIKGNDVTLIKGTTPTTHILKPLLDTVKDSVHNEFFCMRLAELSKIKTSSVFIRWLDDTPYFLTERYDRIRNNSGNILRLHQEDFCQALGIMPEMKYEREGGPSVPQCLKLIQDYSLHPATDQLAFIERLIFNYLIGNADAHGKNHSFLYKNKMPILAPAYDLLCTALYPNLSPKMAMKVGKTYDPEFILLRYWNQIVPTTKMAQKNLKKMALTLSKESLDKAYELKSILAIEGIKSPIFEDICQIIKKRSESLRSIFI